MKMKKSIFVSFVLCCFSAFFIYAQPEDFNFGDIKMSEINLKAFAGDSTATAVVLREFGSAHIDSETHRLIFRYHVRIKILNRDGVKHANFEIPVQKQDNAGETFRLDEASTFSYNFNSGQLKATNLERRNVFRENLHKYLDLYKFTMPDVQEGSIIEVKYDIESPFIFNFRQWDFQSDIPKLESVYKATIPANYVYNIALKGFLKLDINENKIVKECFGFRVAKKADCSVLYLGMKNIPAFVKEDFMTAPSNFISSVQFELSEVIRFGGGATKITKTWKAVETELRDDNRFGKQLKRGKEVFKKDLDPLLVKTQDPLQKATVIYDFIKQYFRWNGYYGRYSENGIKKAYDEKTGNIGDINLSLIAALQAYGFDAEPVLCSTRENGLPVDLYPVLSDFNYVFCRVNIDSKAYMLDASDPYLPFGMLPIRCMNGNGRALHAKESYWMEILPERELKQTTTLLLKLEPDGSLNGDVRISSSDYEALSKRKNMASFNSEEEYVEDTDNKLPRMSIKDFKIENRYDVTQSLMEKYSVQFESFDSLGMNRIYFNPFIFDKWTENPFKSSERLYPVDFGAPLSYTYTLIFEYPDHYQVMALPEKVTLALPDNGGSFTFDVQNDGNRITMRSLLKTSRYIYNSDEYHALREIFARIVQLHKTDVVLERRISHKSDE